MPRLVHLSLTALAMLSCGLMISSSAFAADQNTYRPGHAYLKAAANSFEACEQQCSGDAQCRGWNFVRPNPRSQTGICEFNERAATPVRSAISVSGEISTSVDPLMSRAIPAGARTRRVGTPEAPAKAQQRPTNVKRMPVPTTRRTGQPTTHTRPVPQNQNVRQSRTYGGGSPAPTAQSRAVAPAPTGQMTPQQQHYRQQFLLEQQRARQFRAQQQAALRRQQQLANPHMGPRPQMGPQMPAQQQMAPQQSGPQMPAPQMAPQMAPRPAGAPQLSTGPMVQKSLYGSLHDDLTKNMTPVARPSTAPDNLNNPDAPVSTSRAAPTKPVQTAPLSGQTEPALAGGQ